ncbi:MAG TPA: energy-coupled thiamine transporter ThiT [Tissierellia bacterium]|jgi:thiamine transporter|nr:energy-coupled thiamine transporter ThiT [Tissierellia bacterium]
MFAVTQIWTDFVGKISEIPQSFSEALQEIAANPLSLAVLVLLFIGLIMMVRFGKIRFTPRLIAHMALAVAMAVILDMIVLFRMPQGGSVTPGSMVPLILLALAYGPSVGLLAGFVFGLLNLLLGAYILQPLQVLLDYPLPFMFIGLAGAFPRHMNLGTILAFFLRLISHVVSGVVFFYMYTPEGMSPLWYSITYNGTFLLAELAITLVLLNLMPVPRLVRTMNPQAPEISR